MESIFFLKIKYRKVGWETLRNDLKLNDTARTSKIGSALEINKTFRLYLVVICKIHCSEFYGNNYFYCSVKFTKYIFKIFVKGNHDMAFSGEVQNLLSSLKP